MKKIICITCGTALEYVPVDAVKSLSFCANGVCDEVWLKRQRELTLLQRDTDKLVV